MVSALTTASSETQGQLVGSWGNQSGQVYKNERRAPGILLLTDQFRSQLKSLSVIGHKNIFVPNQSPALYVLLSWLLIRRSSPSNCLIACSPYLSASCKRVSLDRVLPLKGEPWNRKNLQIWNVCRPTWKKNQPRKLDCGLIESKFVTRVR